MTDTRQLYTIVWGDSSSDLCEKVNKEYLKHGWKLAGGVSQAIATTLGKERKIFIQAVYQDIQKT